MARCTRDHNIRYFPLAGGGFRETISNISDDLNSDRTPLFMRTPNNAHEVGDLRDAWMPSPGCVDWPKFEFVGRLMAGAIQTDEVRIYLGEYWSII
jgi:hypothetical protein